MRHLKQRNKARPRPTLQRWAGRAFCFFCTLLIGFVGTPAAAQIDAEAVIVMGRNALSVDDYLTAIRYFNQAIESKPYLSQPYYYRAYAKFTLEDYTGAEDDCTRSIGLNPFIVEVYQLRGLCRIHNDNFVGAIDDYTRALAEQPEDQGTRYNRALCFLQLKRYEQADADLAFLLEKWPNYTRTYTVKAQSLLEQKDTTEALVWIDRLLTKNEKDADAWSFKGRYKLSKNRYAEADTALSQAIRFRPTDYELFILRAQARHALDRFGLAIDDYDEALRLQPTHFVAHYNRGLLRSFVGDLNRAIDDFNFVLSVEPDNTLALYNRAMLRARVGELRGAIADYTALIRAYPNFTYGYQQRAELRRKVGDVRGAVNDETVVARRGLDLAYARNQRTRTKKVRLRSEHELDQYQQLVQEDADTARNVFGTLFGKVQNEQVSDELLPMFAPAFRSVSTRAYRSTAFMAEMTRYVHADTPSRQFVLTAEQDGTAAGEALADARRIEQNEARTSRLEAALIRAAVATARYDYTSALNEANCAVSADSTSVVALLMRCNVLARSAASSTVSADDVRPRLALATADLHRAAELAPENPLIAYNLGCLLAQQRQDEAALRSFDIALQMDNRLAEAYYNRGLIRVRLGQRTEAVADFSRAGQLGLYKAYALIKKMR